MSRRQPRSSIAPGRLHPVSGQSCSIWVLASRPAFVRPCE